MTLSEQSMADLESAISAAQRAEPVLARVPRDRRATGLRAVAITLRDHRDELVGLADEETSLGAPRLDGELTRTAFQLELFAELIDANVACGGVVDRADPEWPPAPRPDLRRRKVPIGIVAMFSASNFPFAFSVAGGDTASAIAAGCPVIVKVHSGHPRLSRRVGELAAAALVSAGLPAGSLGLIEGREHGRRLVLDDRVDAVAFTGSTGGGRALFDLAAGRPRPIPFYGELGSVNPVFVTERAAADHGDQIWTELVSSFTLGAGQFCTKPGIVFAPRKAAAPSAVSQRLGSDRSWPMLDDRIARGYADRIDQMSARPDVDTILAGRTDGIVSSPTLLRTDVADFLADPAGLSEECFGPTTLLVEYDDERQLVDAARQFVGELTSTLQAMPDDSIVPELLDELEPRAGRLIWNQWPTGVSVTGAMQHGGPYPSSTSSRDTSVGTAAIERFLRPVAYQNFPADLLPVDLRD
jgi:NADP-dependent aldehyde dehydrogenase